MEAHDVVHRQHAGGEPVDGAPYLSLIVAEPYFVDVQPDAMSGRAQGPHDVDDLVGEDAVGLGIELEEEVGLDALLLCQSSKHQRVARRDIDVVPQEEDLAVSGRTVEACEY